MKKEHPKKQNFEYCNPVQYQPKSQISFIKKFGRNTKFDRNQIKKGKKKNRKKKIGKKMKRKKIKREKGNKSPKRKAK